jgi:hypothetical protein
VRLLLLRLVVLCIGKRELAHGEIPCNVAPGYRTDIHWVVAACRQVTAPESSEVIINALKIIELNEK